MSLQFILGGSGTGKSTYVFDKIIERSMQEEDKNFFILVPDQFTMQTQMDIVSRHPRKGIMNIDVLSFGRLAYRILEETGTNRTRVLDDTGKSLVLRKVAEELKEEVPILGSQLKKIGYIHEVKSAISEFMQYGIGQEEMKKMLQVSQKRGGLYGKLKDLNTLYQGFLNYIQDRFITTEETYDLLAKQLEKSKLIKESVVVLDGFTGFTPIQNRVIEKLLLLADEVWLTLTLDQKEMAQTKGEEQQLFYLSKKTLVSIRTLAQNAGVQIEEPVWMEEIPKRFQDSGALTHLAKHLFRYPLVSYQEKNDSIVFLENDTMEEEVKNTCKAIRDLLKEDYCYRDIAVICTDLGAYSSFLEEIFTQYEIPFFLDQTRKITLNPFIEYIRSAIGILVKQYSYEAMFHYLRSGMVNLDREAIDKLENYVLAVGIKGKKAWNTLFVKSSSKEKDSKELEELNGYRQQIVEELSVLTPGKHKVKKLVEDLYAFLTANECQQKLKKYEERFRALGEPAKEKEYAQIYPLVMDLLDQIVSLLGEEVLTWEEFGQILDAGFGEIQVGTIPQAVDQVVIGDMERTRLKQVKALFFLGINDGKVPKQSGGGILSDIDREFLSQNDLELAPTPRQQMFIQKFYLYLNVTKPSKKLFLSYARLNGEGKSMKPSYFIESIHKLFDKTPIQIPEKESMDSVMIPEEGRVFGAKLLGKLKNGQTTKEEEEILFSLLAALQKKEEENPWVEDILDSVFYGYHQDNISKEAARLLYGTLIHASVSRLEKMASCAYAHFLQYGLQLQERQEYSFQAVDMGNVFHGVLEIFAGKLAEKNYTWISFPEEEGKNILHEVLESYAINYGNTVIFSSARNAYAMEKMERILWRSVRTLQYQLQKGKFLPKNYEVSFSVLEDLDAVTIGLSEQEKMRLRGRIDRVDTYEKEDQVYVKVVDYKSGNHQFQLAALYHGLSLQLVVYLNAAIEMHQKKQPDKKIIPAGLVYYHCDDPMIDGNESMTAEEIEKAIKKELRVTGIVNSDSEVLNSLDTSHEEKSDVIPVEYKKDGTLSSRSRVMTEEQLWMVQDFAREKVKQLGKEMISGVVSANPCTFKDRDACTFCQFQTICNFDSRLKGFEKRDLQELPEEDIWQEIRSLVQKDESEKTLAQTNEMEKTGSRTDNKEKTLVQTNEREKTGSWTDKKEKFHSKEDA